MNNIPHYFNGMAHGHSRTKHFTAFLLSCLFLPLPSMAYDFEEGGLYFNILGTDDPPTVELTYAGDSGERYSGEVDIPNVVTHDGATYRVTTIGDKAFSGCTSLSAVTIPEGVERIGVNAFRNCTSLASVSLPSSIRVIDDRAFRYCESLEHLVIAEGVTRIGDNAFGGCSALRSVTLPSGVLHYGDGVFYDCASLEEL